MVSEQCLFILVNMLSSISLSALADRDLNMLGNYFSQFAYKATFTFESIISQFFHVYYRSY